MSKVYADMENVIIIGSGPAGLTAAIYTSRALLKPLMFEGFPAGGQLMITTDVENYPGFPEGVMGPDFITACRKQAERFGTRLESKNVTKVDFSKRPFRVEVDSDVFEAASVIIATGANAKLLGLDSEKRLMGKGVSACATCDGAFFRDQDVVVIGGGDTAMEEAMFLTRFASTVTIIHRRDELRASQIMQVKARNHPKIKFQWNTVVEDFLGENALEAVKLKDVKAGKVFDMKCQGGFIAIGHQPNTELFQGQIEMDDQGYILTKEGARTNIGGVFACGDVQDHTYRQAITAAGSGCMAAIDCERYLEATAG